MKKHFYLAALFIFLNLLISYSQPIITSGVLPSPGQFDVSVTVNPNGINEGSSGASQNWSFLGLTTTSIDTTLYYNAASTTYYSYYPSSNIAFQNLPVTAPYFGYATGNNDSAVINGVVFDFLGTTLNINYKNPEKVIEYPATFNSFMNDPYEIVISPYEFPPGSGVFNSAHTVGTVSYLVDGWGTLTTPAGTCNSVLRFKRYRQQVDTTFQNGAIVEIERRHETQYSWTCAGGGPSFNIVYDTTFSNVNGTNSQKNVQYSLGVFTSVSKQELSKSDFSISPNPVNSLLTLSYNGKSTLIDYYLTITNVFGQQVSKTELNSFDKIAIDVSQLKAGVYLISLNTRDGILTQKFIKL